MGRTRTGAPTPFTPSYQGRRPLGSGHVDATVVARARPISTSRDQLLPVLPALAPLFPRGGLQRGAVVAVHLGRAKPGDPDDRQPAPGAGGGGTTLAWALLVGASAGSWCAAVGTADPGVVALADLGMDLGHLVMAPCPGPRWPEVTALFLDAMGVVLVQPPGRVRPGVARRLGARARERRAVLVVMGRQGWPEGADVELKIERAGWQGLEAGHGHLQRRYAEVLSAGRRAAARATRAGLWLPDPTGRVQAAPGPPAGAGSHGTVPHATALHGPARQTDK